MIGWLAFGEWCIALITTLQEPFINPLFFLILSNLGLYLALIVLMRFEK